MAKDKVYFLAPKKGGGWSVRTVVEHGKYHSHQPTSWRGPHASKLDAEYAAHDNKPGPSGAERTKARADRMLERMRAAEARHREADPHCTCNDCIAHHAAQEAKSHDAEPPARVVCPDCGADVQASVKFDCDVDPITGVIDRALSGGEVSLYCADDCGWNADHGDLAGIDDWPEPLKAADLEPTDKDGDR